MALSFSHLQQILPSALPKLSVERLNRAFALLVSIILVSVIGFQAAELTWKAVLPDTILTTNASNRINIDNASSKQSSPIQNTLQTLPTMAEVTASLNRFNPWEVQLPEETPEPIIQQPEPEIEPVVVSELNILLIGTIILSDPKKSVAILVENKRSRDQIFLRPGQGHESAILERVESKAAYFRNGGRLEVIHMEEDEATQTKSTVKSIKPVNTQASLRPTTTYVAKKKFNRMLGQGLSLFRGVNFKPESGLPGGDGYRISSSRHNPNLQLLGIRNDDVIQRINGQQLNDLSQANQLINKLKDQSVISLEMMRNGQSHTHHIRIGG
ncbi:MAG: hypothetical protein HQL54_01260 [Magnetococcales bacterium]|nr:hypothetical protein [Magnetococcales bacterium]